LALAGTGASTVSVCFLTLNLPGGALFVSFRWSAIAAASRSSLRKRGADCQQGDGNPCGDVFCFHHFGWFVSLLGSARRRILSMK
jgi:hypothetical protein